MLSSKEKNQLYLEYAKYCGWIVKMFLLRYPNYKYLQEELVQECAIRFLTVIDKYDKDRSELTTFLCTQLDYHLGKYVLKEMKYHNRKQEYQEELETLYPNRLSADDNRGFNELISSKGISEDQRTRLFRYFGLGQTYQEIAGIEGVSKDAVCKSINKALEVIKKSL